MRRAATGYGMLRWRLADRVSASASTRLDDDLAVHDIDAEPVGARPDLAQRNLHAIVDHPLQEPRTEGEAVPFADDRVDRLRA